MHSPPDGNISSNSRLQIAAEHTESLVEGNGFSYTFDNIQKKKYILTLMDLFSILMMTVPIHDKSAKTVVSRWIFLLGKCVCTLTVFFLISYTTINQIIEHEEQGRPTAILKSKFPYYVRPTTLKTITVRDAAFLGSLWEGNFFHCRNRTVICD